MPDQGITSKIRTQNCKGKMFILKFIFSAFKSDSGNYLAVLVNFMSFPTEME